MLLEFLKSTKKIQTLGTDKTTNPRDQQTNIENKLTKQETLNNQANNSDYPDFLANQINANELQQLLTPAIINTKESVYFYAVSKVEQALIHKQIKLSNEATDILNTIPEVSTEKKVKLINELFNKHPKDLELLLKWGFFEILISNAQKSSEMSLEKHSQDTMITDDRSEAKPQTFQNEVETDVEETVEKKITKAMRDLEEVVIQLEKQFLVNN